jgi:hypothetical protein
MILGGGMNIAISPVWLPSAVTWLNMALISRKENLNGANAGQNLVLRARRRLNYASYVLI